MGRIPALFASALLLFSPLFTPPNAWGQTLSEAVRLGLSQNPRIQAARENVESAERRQRGAEAGYLPTLDFGMGFGREWSNTTTTRPANGEILLQRGESSVSFDQMLFDGFATRSEVAAAAATVAAEEASLDLTAETLVLETVEAYLDIVERSRLLALLEEQRALLEKILSRVQEMEALGLGTRVDVFQAENRLQSLHADLITARGRLQESEALFREVVGEAPVDLQQPETPLALMPNRLEQALDEALSRHPTLRRSRFELATAEARHQGDRAELWPQVSFQVDYSNNDNISGVRSYSQNIKAMLQLSFNLFNGGADSAAIEESRDRIDRGQALLDQSRNEISVGVRTAWSAFRTSRRGLAHLRDALDGVQRVTAAYHEQFQMGQRTLLDVLNSENELFGTQRSLITEEIGLLRASYRLLGAMGMLQSILTTETPSLLTATLGDFAAAPTAPPDESTPPADGAAPLPGMVFSALVGLPAESDPAPPVGAAGDAVFQALIGVEGTIPALTIRIANPPAPAPDVADPRRIANPPAPDVADPRRIANPPAPDSVDPLQLLQLHRGASPDFTASDQNATAPMPLASPSDLASPSKPLPTPLDEAPPPAQPDLQGGGAPLPAHDSPNPGEGVLLAPANISEPALSRDERVFRALVEPSFSH